MTLLRHLQEQNPGLRLFDVHDPAFAPYGRVLDVNGLPALKETLSRCAIPEAGNRYAASVPELEALPAIEEIRRQAFGDMPVQAGYCNGRGYTLNALEYHRCSEVNFSTTGLVLLLALPGQVRDRRIDASEVVGVYLPPETPVELWPRVLHFAPCRVREAGFDCLVVLERGTNTPLERVDPAADGEDGLLWMRNKWLLCHSDSPQAANGAFVGITGENLTLKL